MKLILNQQTVRRLSSSATVTLQFAGPEIKDLIQQGRHVQALQLYARHNPLSISKYTFPSLLKACASLSNLRYGRTIHSTIVTTGGDSSIWNSISDGYFRFGRVDEGIAHFRRMQASGFRADGYSLCILLGNLGYEQGRQAHGYIVRNVVCGDPFLESSLLDMYFRCGRPMASWRVFRRIENRRRNVVAWNVMMGGLAENGFWEGSLELYLMAKSEQVELVSASFTNTLGACGQGDCVSFGEQVHSDVVKMGFEDDEYVCTSLMTMYAKCKLVEDAERVFEKVRGKGIGLWNAMISAYAANGCVHGALGTYREMKLSRILPDSFTMSHVISCCSTDELVDFGRSVHADFVKRPIERTVSAESALLTLYSKYGLEYDAYLIFSSMKDRDVVAWGSMISGFCQNGKFVEALVRFGEMEEHGVKPDSDIMASVISSCAGIENVKLGGLMHGLVIKSGLEHDVFVASSLLDMYSKCGLPELADNVFSYMRFKNIVAWNSMMSCYSRNGQPERSIDMFSEFLKCGMDPDSLSVTNVLVAVSSMAALLRGKALHGYLIRRGIRSDIHVENALIDMYLKCGLLRYAQNVFQKMHLKNLVTWNSMIDGYGSHGECWKAIALLDEMLNSGVKPDHITFLSLLSSCNHSGLIEQGYGLFNSMEKEYGVEPRSEHYVNIVDMLGRAGRLDDAYALINNMPTEPEQSIWVSLLSSSRAHHNVHLGEVAATELLKIEPSKGSNYAQILNIYGEAEMWDSAAKLRALMKEKGVKKKGGCSWIEVRNRVDVFFSGDSSSPQTLQIYDALGSLRRNMVTKESKFDIIEAFLSH
ncbi:Pentatricopeptide repeat-containing protein At2g40720 [Linum grandiflorum]